MKLVECTECGSRELNEVGGYVICVYCSLKFVPNLGDLPVTQTEISVYDDIKELLEKCKNDPANRKRLASLVLDIDPTNEEAKQYLA
jgi:DNA-directed RNA polymerase subunit RPC12/RpoP